MIEIIKAIIFGIVEGITEWLPISSTGHLILFEKIFAFKNVSEGFWSMFEVVIQLGAILAVVVLFWNSIFPFTNKNGRGFKESGILSHLDKEITTLWFKIIVACIPAVIFVVLGLDDVCEAMFYNYFCVAIALIVFGVAFIVVENWNKNRTSKINSLGEITYQTALMIGLFQLIAAVFPGTSRSGATIVGALLIGVSRTVAAEYTFFLAIPVMFGRGFKESGILSHLDKEITTLWFKIIVACIPAVIFVVLGLDDVCEAMFYNYFCVAIALIVFGVAFIVVENWNKNRTSKINSLGEITYQTALMIGLFQLIAAVFPGTSRSGATIVGALLIGVSRTVAAEYTFFLAIPVMFGASLLKIVKFGFNFTAMEAALLIIGMAAAFVVSLFVIRFLMGYIKKHDFKVFGWYRIILGAIVLLLRP